MSSVELDAASATGESVETSVREQTVPDESLGADVVFSLLKSSRRRRALRHLNREGGSLTLGELAEYVAADENETSVAQLTSSQRKRVYVSLYQSHLPKLDDAGVVDFDRGRGTIERRDRATRLEQYLDGGDETPDSWWQTYLGIALAGGAAYAAQRVLFGPDVVTSVAAVAGLVLAISLVALAQRQQLREGD
jgi:DNA-binding transcriptional ArsR family regulator